MKIIETYFNIIHYSVFKFLNAFNFSNKNDFDLDINEEIKFKRHGTDLMFANGIVNGLLFIIFTIIFNIINNIFHVFEIIPIYIFILLGYLSIVTCYNLTFKKEKYLFYFIQLDKRPNKTMYHFISLLSIVIILVLFIYSINF